MAPTRYYGADVRTVSTGAGLEDFIEVQELSPVSGGWHGVRRFYQSDNYASTGAAIFARDHAARKPKPKADA